MPPKKAATKIANTRKKLREPAKESKDVDDAENAPVNGNGDGEDIEAKAAAPPPLKKRAATKTQKKVEDVETEEVKKKPAAKGKAAAKDKKVEEDVKASKNVTARKPAKRVANKAVDKVEEAPSDDEDDSTVATENPPGKKTTKKADVPKKKAVAKKKVTAKKGKKELTPAEEEDVEMAPPVDKDEQSPDEEKSTKKATKKAPAKSRAKKTSKVVADDDDEEEVATSKRGRKREAAPSNDEPTVKKTASSNVTTTKWEEISFISERKNPAGESANYRIISWNVDGIRAWEKKGGLSILQYAKPDILCLQEIKCTVDKLPESLTREDSDYKGYWCSSEKEGYAGVGFLSKVLPIEVTNGIGDEQQDAEGRCITAEFEKFFLVNVYVPNAGRGLVTLPKRLEWNKLFKKYISDLDRKKPVIICGDMNVAHAEIDLANPKTNTKNAGFTPQEREGMTDFLKAGYVDTFRDLYPDLEKAYTFWTYLRNARSKNVGWRLDYFIVSDRFKGAVCDSVINEEVFGSDHCPITVHLRI